MRVYLYGILLFLVMIWSGCESHVQPAKVVINYSTELFIGANPELYSCRDLINPDKCNSHRDPAIAPVEVDSVVISDFDIVSNLWHMSNPEHFVERPKGRLFSIRICVRFYDMNDIEMRTVWLSHFYIMQISGIEYLRDVPLFNAIVEYLPDEYLKMDSWFKGLPADTTKDYYYDPETHYYRDADGNIMVSYSGTTVVPVSEITGDLADSGYYYRVPASEVTGNSTDTGFYYLNMEDRIFGDREKVYLDSEGNVVFRIPPPR